MELLLIVLALILLPIFVVKLLDLRRNRYNRHRSEHQVEVPPVRSPVRLTPAHDTEFGHLPDVGEFSVAPVDPGPGNLPDRYDVDRMILMVRDPYWLHTYWELTPRREMELERLIGAENYASSTALVRLINIDTTEVWEAVCGLHATNWYLNPARPGDAFVCELSCRDRKGHYHLLLRSNVVRTPRDCPSDKIDPEWATADELWARLNPWGYRLYGGASPGIEYIRFRPHVGASPGMGMSPWERSG